MDMKRIADGLRMIADGLDNEAASVNRGNKKADTKPRKTAPKTEESEPVAEKEEPTTAEPAEVTKVEVISALQAVAKAKDRAAIDKILADFNVAKVGQLAEEDYADVVAVAKAAVE